MTVMETVGTVDMEFMITGGYNFERTRALAVTKDLSAMAGIVRFFFYTFPGGPFFMIRPYV